MAAVASDTVTITINDVDLAVPKGELIVESVKRLGLEIPIFCYHPRMKPVGMCRMCIVEVGFKQPDGTVRKMPKPQAACTLPASDGMVVYTDTESVHTDRKGVLEFLLINHPLDCPICDRGGECPLQNNTLFYGPSTSRFTEIKRHLPKAFPLSKHVTLDLERCIQCGRCVRFTEEISGDSQLAFRFRGANMQPSTFKLTDFDSKFSGNTVEICPVGALTNAQYRFRARPWDLETRPAICTLCSNGCNIWLDHRVGKMVRINGRTNEAVNEEWTCDRGKYGHDFYNSPHRLKHPLVRRGEALVQAGWSEGYEEIIQHFQNAGRAAAALVEPTCANEDLYMLQKLFRGSFGSNNLDHRFTRHLPTAEEHLELKMSVKTVNTPLAQFEKKSSIFVFGTSLADEEPILFLRVRKAWFMHGARVVVAHHSPTDVDSFAHLVLRYMPGTEDALASGLLAEAVRVGRASVPEALKARLGEYTPDKTEKLTGVPADRIREAVALVGPEAALITTRSLLNVGRAQDVLETLASLAMTLGAQFNNYALLSNEQGAEDVGILPDMLPGLKPLPAETRGLNTQQILEGCLNGQIQALWLVGVDPFEKFVERDRVQAALENVPFLVYQGIEDNEAAKYASVVLPQTAPAEQDGSYTNLERRIQRMQHVFGGPGDSKPGWRIFSEVALRITPSTPAFNPAEIMEDIAKEVPWMESNVYDRLDGEGSLEWNGPLAASYEMR
ncbi:MAG TPA: NADH-quinone oxidoreductase subunit NuoG [Fimbriimonadaceae bacterium]|nr:NADH-quinone oxidoreductase subunit NuoG [Fimbriimonadaceae bacterium]